VFFHCFTVEFFFNEPAEHDDAPPHRAARVFIASTREAGHRFPPKLPQVQPPHGARHLSSTFTPAAHHQPQQGSQPKLPSRAATHTPVSRHAPATPVCSATMGHSSGRARTWEMARKAFARRVVGGIADERVRCPLCWWARVLCQSEEGPAGLP
jgi:hypothetical protein